MALNESKGNMYEFVTHTWNTIKGLCPHGCTYCYMGRWGKQKPVRFDEKELKTNLGNGNFIFVGSSCDMFADEIPNEWIGKTLEHCRKFDNNYMFQTKDPYRVIAYMSELPEKSALCTTIETNRDYGSIMQHSPSPLWRAKSMEYIDILPKYVTIEPIMEFDLIDLVKLIRICNPIQVNVGADTGHNKLPEPCKRKVLQLISALSEFSTVHQKSNLKRLLK